MKITLKTKVEGNYKEVMEKFDINLFEALKPPLADMEIVEFTGSKRGDRVHIRFNAPIKAEWVSLITEHGHDEHQAYFIDEGEVLPFPLKKWRHKHIVEKINESESYIIDEMSFSGSNWLMDIFIYPGILLGFLPRKRIYKKYFSK